MKVQKNQCNQCLFTKNRVVSKERMLDVVEQTLKQNTYFECHKATIQKQDVCCKGYWDRYKDHFTLGRIIQRLGGPECVELK